MNQGMKRRDFLKTGTCGACAGLMAANSPLSAVRASDKPPMGAKRPNILWISCEDISPRLGCYGDGVARTPNLDRLAREGMRYDKVFTSAPVCAPNRTAIITGMYQTSIGSQHMRTTHKGEGLPTPYHACPPPYVKTFTEYLRAEGYYCTNNSKTDYQFGLPVTSWDETSNTAHYKNRRDKNQPFFAVFNLTMTHESRNWPDPEFTDPADVEVPPYYPDTLTVRKDIARLYDNIAAMDTRAGELLTELENEGLADNTVVFFWSDHGDGLPRKKRWIYDSGTHVPLIVRWPREIKPESVNDNLISSIDFGPSVLSIAGAMIPAHMQGRPFLGPKTDKRREYVFSARDRFDESYDMVRSVRDRRYRYIRNFYPEKPYILWIPYRNQGPAMAEMLRLHAEGKLEGPQKLWFSDKRPPEELYDCVADPHNIKNLADDPSHRHTLERMRGVLDLWRLESKDMGDISEEMMVRQWYPNGVQPETAKPKFIPNDRSNRGQTPVENRAQLESPAMISLHCATQGASIAYTSEEGDNPRWLLYSGPMKMKKGTTVLRAKAIRYGYAESAEERVEFQIK